MVEDPAEEERGQRANDRMAEAITKAAEQMELLKSRMDDREQDKGKPNLESRFSRRVVRLDDDED